MVQMKGENNTFNHETTTFPSSPGTFSLLLSVIGPHLNQHSWLAMYDTDGSFQLVNVDNCVTFRV